MSDHTYDVVVLGSGFGGTVLSTILARQGLKVLIIDAKSHPRFAIGESTIPHTSQLISVLAREFDVPELQYIGLGSPKGIREHIGPTSGIKRIFGFAYHELDKEHDPAHGIQFGNYWRDENHLFRQDVDMYLAQLAAYYGAELRENTRVASIDFEPDCVRLETESGDRVMAKYLVDGTGFRSVLAEKFGLREDPPRFKHQSRTIFTHMRGVRPFEDVVDNWGSNGWSQGTLHHLFEGGWFWVIPFNNTPESTNPLVSVGLTIDPRRYPMNGLSGEEEFNAFLNRLPSIARQFEGAEAVRPWVKTGRLQFSSSKVTGHRYCLLSHAAGFIDPLFSRGLINTLEVVHGLARTLLASFEDGDFSQERFEPIDTLQHQILDYADRVVNGSFISWANFDIWNAWMRIWAIGSGEVESNLASFLFMGKASRWRAAQNPIFTPFENPNYRQLFESCERIILKYASGGLSDQEAADQLFAQIQSYDLHMPLRNGSDSHQWALTNPGSRDLFIGHESLHERWEVRESDPGIQVVSASN